MSEVGEAPPRADANARACKSQGSFVWYELMTPDPEGAKAFYEPVVGWSMTTGHGDNQDYGFITRTGGGMSGGVLRLTEEMREHGARPCWLGYIGVEDVDAAVREIESSGGKCLMPARDIEMAGRIAMVADPAGAPFYVMKPRPPESREEAESKVFSVDEPQHVRWNELSTSDPEGAVNFYGKRFGWVEDGGMDMGEMGRYRFINDNGVMIGAIMPRMPQMPVSLWTYYIGVDDIDRAGSAIEQGGGKILNGPMEIPGGEFALNAMDPQGAAFGLVGPRKP
jgi:predicted enzyme related to lactoylglutathione lyase